MSIGNLLALFAFIFFFLLGIKVIVPMLNVIWSDDWDKEIERYDDTDNSKG